jgi:NADPH:quinone reductase-like Zn-dependent oxidoreductase
MEKSFKAIAYDGRYLIMGFASNKRVADEKFLVPRALSMGNFSVCGVVLSYAPAQAVPMMKAHTGWNFASTAMGAEITKKLVDLYLAKKIRPIIGETVSFADVPQAFDDFAESRTVGRVVVVM